MSKAHKITLLDTRLAICRLEPGSLASNWAPQEPFSAIIRTNDETSIVCAMDSVPPGSKVNADWQALKIQGPLPFELVGVLANLAQILAQAGISIFVLSTYETDYILVKVDQVNSAISALRAAGHFVFGEKT